MKDKTRVPSSKVLRWTQVLVWCSIILAPVVFMLIEGRTITSIISIFGQSALSALLFMAVYFIYFYGLRRLAHDHKVKFIIGNIVLFAIFDAVKLGIDSRGLHGLIPVYNASLTYLFLFLFDCAMAEIVWQIAQGRMAKAELAAEQQKATEAELNWLKMQLNPHFLFNTLNNISALTQIDADKAQQAIGELSDMMRYAIYDTKMREVDIKDEAVFIQNYISLMRLRYDDSVRIETKFNLSHNYKIAPLLTISLIENAFKHGIVPDGESLIRIAMTTDSEGLILECSNTDAPKAGNDKSGSGIGLANVRRRLDLLYPGQYQWTTDVKNGMYNVKLKIKLCEN